MLNKLLLTLLLIPFSLDAGRFTGAVNEPLEDHSIETVRQRKIEINSYVFEKYTEYTTVSDMYLVLSAHVAVPEDSISLLLYISRHYKTKAELWYNAGVLANLHVICVATKLRQRGDYYQNQYQPHGKLHSLRESMNFHYRALMELKIIDKKIHSTEGEDFYAGKEAVNILIKYENWKKSSALKRYESARYHDH